MYTGRCLRRSHLVICCVLAAVPPVTAKSKAKAPAGVSIEARLLTPFGSYTAKAGTEVEAAIATTLCPASGDVLPEDAILHGTVTKGHRVGLGLLHETAALRVEFRELRLPDGRVYPIRSQLTGIENARERVDRGGTIRGIRATATLSNRIGERLAFLAMGSPISGLPLLVAEIGLLRYPNPEIELKRGGDLRLSVEFPPEFGTVAECAGPQELSAFDWSELQSLVDGLPYWTYSTRQQRQDPINLVYIGSQEEISRAFQAAGWVGSRPNSMRAGLNVMRAIAENQNVHEGPMSVLLLEGATPDILFQKSLDTFEKRDHLRVWARTQTLGGSAVWAAAATRDIAAVLSTRPFGFTHRIQGDVDIERDQVARDLAFTGCVDWVAYVARPKTLRASGEGFRSGLSTDSRVAVVMLNSCATPRQDLSFAGEFRRPGWLVRGVRRVTLTARNHFLRDNLVWRSADAVRMAYGWGRRWRQERKNETEAQALDARLNALPELRKSFAVCSADCGTHGAPRGEQLVLSKPE